MFLDTASEDLEGLRMQLIAYMRDELTYPAVYASVCRAISDQGRELSEAISGLSDALLLWKSDNSNASPSFAYDSMFDECRKEPCEVAYRLRQKYLFIKHNHTIFENDIHAEFKLPRSLSGESQEIDAICEALDKISYYMAIAKGIMMWETPRGAKESAHVFCVNYDDYYEPYIDDFKLRNEEYKGSPASRYGTPADRLEVLFEMCKKELVKTESYNHTNR